MLISVKKCRQVTSEQEDAQIATYQKLLSTRKNQLNLAPINQFPIYVAQLPNGRIALFKGIFSVAGVVNSVRADCEKAIQLK